MKTYIEDRVSEECKRFSAECKAKDIKRDNVKNADIASLDAEYALCDLLNGLYSQSGGTREIPASLRTAYIKGLKAYHSLYIKNRS